MLEVGRKQQCLSVEIPQEGLDVFDVEWKEVPPGRGTVRAFSHFPASLSLLSFLDTPLLLPLMPNQSTRVHHPEHVCFVLLAFSWESRRNKRAARQRAAVVDTVRAGAVPGRAGLRQPGLLETGPGQVRGGRGGERV